MLWLALHFYRLPLEVFVPAQQLAAVVEQQVIVTCNDLAEAHGVAAGMRLSDALGMAPDMSVRERTSRLEEETLHRLACWAGSFSPHVMVASNDELLIEIGGCLRLFGGLDVLCEGVRQGAIAQGFSVYMAQAPTPLAAQWLARARHEVCCADIAKLKRQLGLLSIEVLNLSSSTEQTFAALGVKTLQQLFALPSAGLARRFGIQLTVMLAEALGESPDLRPHFVFPESFSHKLELPAKVEQASMLLFASRRLLAGLAGWLAARAAGVAQCSLWLTHDDRLPSSEVVLAFAGPTRDLIRMERVLRERLERLVLRSEVTYITLQANEPLAMPGSSLGLFGQSAAQALDPVIERLRARLGKDAVHGLAIREDYRPECATLAVEHSDVMAVQSTQTPRPLWLLPQPKALREVDGAPHYGSALQRVAGPERIESGWWDQGETVDGEASHGDLKRDYFVAVSTRGEWLWIFRDAQGWWLQGTFA